MDDAKPLTEKDLLAFPEPNGDIPSLNETSGYIAVAVHVLKRPHSGARGQAMTAERSQMSHVPSDTPSDVPRVALHQVIVVVAARELEQALLEQLRPPMGMYVHPSSAEHAAIQRAVRTICGEANRLELRAEELIISIKQAWSQLAPVRARHLGDRDGDVLREVVSCSIEVFFESKDAASATGH